MLLSDSAIHEALRGGGLVITPLNLDDVQPASVDLHLDRELLVHSLNGIRKHDLINDGPFILGPHCFLLGNTIEDIVLPNDIAGEMVGKSSCARKGLVIESAGYFDPGWVGQGTLEISNRSPRPVTLMMGMKICQMRFHSIQGEVARPYGSDGLGSHYQHSLGPVPARD